MQNRMNPIWGLLKKDDLCSFKGKNVSRFNSFNKSGYETSRNTGKIRMELCFTEDTDRNNNKKRLTAGRKNWCTLDQLSWSTDQNFTVLKVKKKLVMFPCINITLELTCRGFGPKFTLAQHKMNQFLVNLLQSLTVRFGIYPSSVSYICCHPNQPSRKDSAAA